MDKPPILFLTNSELGQASVCLAVAHEFLAREYPVHIGSFSPLRDAVSTLNHHPSAPSSSPTSKATFHIIRGRAMKESILLKYGFNIFGTHDVGFWGALKAYKTVLHTMAVPWNGFEYVEGHDSCVEIIEKVRPGIIVVDSLLNQAKDACHTSRRQFVILSPNTFKENVPQPFLANIWKYPQLCSGWPYPLPWWAVLLNIYLTIRLVLSFMSSPSHKEVELYRNSRGIRGPIPNIMTQSSARIPIILPTNPASDFPSVVPEHVTHCGPIVRPCGRLVEEHPELNTWLSQRPTVLISMGSMVSFKVEAQRQFAEGLRMLLETNSDIQVLWKMPREGLDTDEGFKSIDAYISEGRIRIEDWLTASPICILLSGHVKCMVHHGGSNSYHEAILAGVPQIVLPVWFDTFEFAARVEWLGIGIYGNRKTAPAVTGKELGSALNRVLTTSDESVRMQQKAKAIASKLGPVEGRVVACEKIIAILEQWDQSGFV